MWNNLSHIIDWVLDRRILTHILFWISTILVSLLYGMGINQPIMVSLILKGIVLPIQIIASYVFIYKQLPLLYNKQYWRFSISFLLLSYLYQLLVHINNDFGLGTRLISYHKPHDLYSIFTNLDYFILLSIDVYLIVFVVSAIKIIKDNLQSQSERAILETEKAKTEFSLLQSKIQPEYLLNALQLIEEESMQKSDNSPLLIEKLADVLDYSLYQSRKEAVPIQQEIKTLENYVQVYAESKKIDLILDISSNIKNRAAQIVPLTTIKICELLLQHWSGKDEELLLEIDLSPEDKLSMIFRASNQIEKAMDINMTKLTEKLELHLNNNYADSSLLLTNSSTNSNLKIQIKL